MFWEMSGSFGWSVVADQGGGQSSEEKAGVLSRRPGYGNLALLAGWTLYCTLKKQLKSLTSLV